MFRRPLFENKHEASMGFCPGCGLDLTLDGPIARGPMEYDPRGGVQWHGQRLTLKPKEHALLGALLKANGRFVSRDTLLARMGSDEAESNLVSVHVCRLRGKLRAIGGPDPIGTETGHGYRWALVAEQEDDACPSTSSP